MEAIAIMPRTEREMSLVRAVLEYGGIPFTPLAGEIPEEDRYWPALAEEFAEARAEKEAGTVRWLMPEESVEDFWDKLMKDDNV